MTLRKPEGQCEMCGSLPGDEDRIECDWCCFGLDEARAPGAIGEWAIGIFLTIVVSYFAVHFYLWAMRGWSVMP